MGYPESGIEILTGVGNRGVEVPIKDEKIDTEAAGPCQLLFNSTVVIVLPTRKRFSILIGTTGHSLEVEVSERSGPTIKIICPEASTGLSRSRSGACDHARDCEHRGGRAAHSRCRI